MFFVLVTVFTKLPVHNECQSYCPFRLGFLNGGVQRSGTVAAVFTFYILRFCQHRKC